MKIILLCIFFISAVGVVITVLMHQAKGEGLAGIGGHAKVFGSQRGLEAGLNRLTAVLAAIFLISAVVLNLFY